jgi:ABC transporter transmembrane region
MGSLRWNLVCQADIPGEQYYQTFPTPPMLICHVQPSKQGPPSPLHFQCQNVVQQVVNILKIPVLYWYGLDATHALSWKMGGNDTGGEELRTPNPTASGIAKWKWESLFSFSSRQHAPILIVALILSTAAGITGPALAIFFGKIFDAFSAYGSGAADGQMLMHKVSADAVALCVLGSTVWLLKGGYFGLWMVFGELQAKNARDGLFQNLLEKDLEWYEMRTSGTAALLPRLQTYATRFFFVTSTDQLTARFVSFR